MTIRLLYLTSDAYPTFRSDVRVLFGKYLPQYGVYSDIVARKKQDTTEPEPWGGGNTYLCGMTLGTIQRNISVLLHGTKHLLSANSSHYHAIQVRDMPVLATIGLLISHFKKIKFFYWMSYPIPDGKVLQAQQRGLSEGLIKFLFPWIKGHAGQFLLYRVVLPNADHIFVQSEQMKKDLVQCGIDPERMTPVPMGVDIEALQNLNIQPLNDSRFSGKRVLIYLGTMDRPRQIEVLFDMLAIVKQQFPNILLTLVGNNVDGEAHLQWLKLKADKAGMSENIIWTGWLPMLDSWRYVRSAELGLSPFPRGYLLDSASPTKVPEYLAFGVPVVCNDNPDQQQIIRQTGAGLCVPYTAEDFASAVINILSLNEYKRHEMATKGKDYVSQYRSYRKIASNLADSYRNLFL